MSPRLVPSQLLVAEPRALVVFLCHLLEEKLSFGLCWREGAVRAVGHSDEAMNTGADSEGESLGLHPAPACLWPGKISLLLL